MKFSRFVDHVFWSLLLGTVTFGVHFLSKMSVSVESLNEKMAIMMTQLQGEADAVKDHEVRLRVLEGRPH